MWHQKIDPFLIGDLSFSSCAGDHYLYILRTVTSLLLVALYVDDLLISGQSMPQIDSLKRQFSLSFEIKDLGAGSV